MCGITGFVDFNKKTNFDTLVSMTETLLHRGPDDGGYLFENCKTAQLGLGHRRLSILDLSKHGHQPMNFSHLSIIYNGEIYNFKEIRIELEKLGYGFESDSDTEVILKSYHQWGIEAVHRFNGMFAIAIFNKNTQTLTLIRDRVGVKPLFWYKKDGLFMFSSELKSFHKNSRFQKKLNHEGLTLFLQYGYIPEPHTIFNYTHKLCAGHYLELNINNEEFKIKKYWNVFDFYNQKKLKISEQDAIDETEKLLKSAFNYRMISDVPVGVFLSGGYDSSTVTALLQSERTEKIKTFSIGFYEKKYNEAQEAKKIANYLGTDHTEYYCTQKDALEIIPQISEIWDEPFGDSSAIPTTLVSKLARQQVSVSLSADGGDEIFGGYDKYTNIKNKIDLFSKIPTALLPLVKKALNSSITHSSASLFGIFDSSSRLKKTSLLLDKNEKEVLKINSQMFTQYDLDEILINPCKKIETNFDMEINQSWLDNLLAIDFKTYQLDDILTKVDRATMSVSLEGREPLLDHRIIEFVATLDHNLKIKNGEKKYLLKQITHKYLPREIMERPKMGFSVPIEDWFKDELKKYLLYYLDEKRLTSAGIFNTKSVLKLRDKYLTGEKLNINKLWFILIFEMWREKWM